MDSVIFYSFISYLALLSLYFHLDCLENLGLLVVEWDFPNGASGKEPSCQCKRVGDAGSIPGWEDPLEEGMATHSSILSWRISWTEEPGRLLGVAESDTTEAT